MTDLQTFIDQAWTDHAEDAAGVAMRLPAVLDEVRSEPDLQALARLAAHVHGDHLAAWDTGLRYLAALARGPAFDPHGASGALLRRLRAALALAGGGGDARATLDPGERIAVTASAAGMLTLHDVDRALALLREALDAAASTALADADPAVRALAVACNNVAATLEEKDARSDAERALMLVAAQEARRWWARAGSWLEAERAEYRLATCWLAAGDPDRALPHALECLAIVDAQSAPPVLERFFAHDALARAERAAGKPAAQTVQALHRLFERLGPDDQRWCRATLDRHPSPPDRGRGPDAAPPGHTTPAAGDPR